MSITRPRIGVSKLERLRCNRIVTLLRTVGQPMEPIEVARRLKLWKAAVHLIVSLFDELVTMDDGTIWLRDDNSWMDGSAWWHHLQKEF